MVRAACSDRDKVVADGAGQEDCLGCHAVGERRDYVGCERGGSFAGCPVDLRRGRREQPTPCGNAG